MPSNHDNKFFSSQVKLDNSHNATDTSKKSVSKHSLHTHNRDVSDITYPQHDVDVSTSSQHDVCFLSQYDVDVSGLKALNMTQNQDISFRHVLGISRRI